MEKINYDELFRCTKCDYMVDEPSESECCGNLYCQTCTVELKYNQCKVCRKALQFHKNLFAKKLLQKIELKCRHHCGGKFSYEDMKTHLYRCECRIFKCTIEFCSFVGIKSEMVTHMLEKHCIHLITMLENYEEFQETINKIMLNPIDNRPPLKSAYSEINILPMSINDFIPRNLGEMLDVNESFSNLEQLQLGNVNRDTQVENATINRLYGEMDDSLNLYRTGYGNRQHPNTNTRVSYGSFGMSNEINNNNQVNSFSEMYPYPNLQSANRLINRLGNYNIHLTHSNEDSMEDEGDISWN